MAIQESPEAASHRERLILQRICKLIPLFQVTSTTSTTAKHDADGLSGDTRTTSEFKFRTDVSRYDTIPIDVAKYIYLTGKTNPMLIVCCSATTNTYFFDLNKAKPLPQTRWFSTPARNDQPGTNIQRVECVMFKKADADHVVKMSQLSDPDDLLLSVDYVVYANYVDSTDVMYLFHGTPQDMMDKAVALMVRSMGLTGFTAEALNAYRNAIWQAVYLACQCLCDLTYDQVEELAKDRLDKYVTGLQIRSDLADQFDPFTHPINNR